MNAAVLPNVTVNCGTSIKRKTRTHETAPSKTIMKRIATPPDGRTVYEDSRRNVMSVERFDFEASAVNRRDGEYVEYSTYSALEDERDRLLNLCDMQEQTISKLQEELKALQANP